MEVNVEAIKAEVRAKARIDGQEEAREAMVNELAHSLNRMESANHALGYALYSLIAPKREYSEEEQAKLKAFDNAIDEIDEQLADSQLLSLLHKPLEDIRKSLVRDKTSYEEALCHVEAAQIDEVVGKWLEENNVSAVVQDGALFRNGHAETKMGKAVSGNGRVSRRSR